MNETRSSPRVDRDGVKVYEEPHPKRNARRVRIVIAVLLVLVCSAGGWLVLGGVDSVTVTRKAHVRAADTESQDAGEIEVAHPGVRQRRDIRIRAVHVERGRAQPQGEEPAQDDAGANEQPEIDARDVISALVAAGEKEGIAAFPPPGTNPPKSGIVVPEGFELPEGYVRHYQVTDDGQRLEPILMFSPDYQFVDAAGNPIALPDDLIVPPDLAPPGLPIRMLEVPERKLR